MSHISIYLVACDLYRSRSSSSILTHLLVSAIMTSEATQHPSSNMPEDLEKQPNEPLQLDETSRDQSIDRSGTSSPKQPQRERQIRGLRWFLVCVAIFSANFLYGLDTTIAADIQAAVSEEYENVSQLGWLGVGFGLGSTVAILPLGKAFGAFDTKWLFIACLVMFAAASALCGAAPSMNAIIVGRVWAGAGGAGMYLG